MYIDKIRDVWGQFQYFPFTQGACGKVILYLFKATVEKSHTNTPARLFRTYRELIQTPVFLHTFNTYTYSVHICSMVVHCAYLYIVHWFEMPPTRSLTFVFAPSLYVYHLSLRILLQFHIKIHSKSVNVCLYAVSLYRAAMIYPFKYLRTVRVCVCVNSECECCRRLWIIKITTNDTAIIFL